MSKKNINDADFFDDDHLELVGDDLAVADPFGDDDEDDDDGVEAGGVDDADAGGDDDEGSDDAADDVASVEWVDPAPHLPDDPRALKQAYAEARNIGNAKAMEAQKALERVAQLEADLVEFDLPEQQPQYDGNAFAHIATQNPSAAFQYALDNEQYADAQQAIARLQVDAQQLGVAASIAHANDDAQAYQQYRAQAEQAQAQALQMHGELQTRQVAKQQAPFVQQQQAQNVQAAQAALHHATNGDYTARLPQVQRVLQENPGLITGTDPVSLQKAFHTAYKVALAEPAPVTVDPLANVDDAAKAAVEKYFEATRAAKARAAEAAVGADGSRVGPGETTGDDGGKNQIYQSAQSQAQGARAFMNL